MIKNLLSLRHRFKKQQQKNPQMRYLCIDGFLNAYRLKYIK